MAVYIRSGIKYNVISSDHHDGIEHIWISVHCNKSVLALGFVYRPPNMPVTSLNNYEEILRQIHLNYDNVISLGDWNINMLTNTSEKKIITSMFSLYNLTQLVTKPTRITSTTETLIDLITVNKPDSVIEHGQLPPPGDTDHNAIFLKYDMTVDVRKPEHVETRSFKKINMDLFAEDAVAIPWHHLDHVTDVNERVSTLNSFILQ